MEEDDFKVMIKEISYTIYEVLSKNSPKSAPERVVACSSATRCG